MNVLLLGNGFDLNHMFPTSYINFLNTINFLMNTDRTQLHTIGDVWGNSTLQKRDPFIKKCYDVHVGLCHAVTLDKEAVEKMVKKASSNLWFKYLYGSIFQEINWIDFEKEIFRVIEAFTVFFENAKFRLVGKDVIFNFNDDLGAEDRYIIKSFPYFYGTLNNDFPGNKNFIKINPQFLREKIVGSDALHLCESEIIEVLYESLRELADILKEYLKLFIDFLCKEYKDRELITQFPSLPSAERVYSFNYTNTYELLYKPNIVDYIHGNTNTEIVLGVNPDDKDELHNMDTSFLLFKKYFQRTFYSTDNKFLKKIYIDQNMKSISMTAIDVYVIGHSLDATDKDIIELIFSSANRIFILYHNETSAKNQIRNLIEMYGKLGFDRLRSEKNLCFLKQSGVEWITLEEMSGIYSSTEPV